MPGVPGRVGDRQHPALKLPSVSSPPSVTPSSTLAYSILDSPPWPLCVLLGLQHCVTAMGGLVAIPLLLSRFLCVPPGQPGDEVRSHLVSPILFVSGMCTLRQATGGIRLPIVQGGTFTFLVPSVALLSLPEWRCEEAGAEGGAAPPPGGGGWPPPGLNHTAASATAISWQARICELQGAIMVASCFQMLLGCSGAMGWLLRLVGPLSIAPTVALIGLSLVRSAATSAGHHWGVACMTIALIVLFSQYLRDLHVPLLPAWRGGPRLKPLPIFKLFPVLLGMGLAWLVCHLLTVCGGLPHQPDAYGYLARTDLKAEAMGSAPWIYLPYPGQWGVPSVSAAGAVGMLAGVVSSVVESVGDYHACARLSGAPPPPRHAVNRGIALEGLGCLLAGAWGTGNGTTSYSENVAAIGITKVGSRSVVLSAGLWLLLLGVFGKAGALLACIPEPVIGGMLIVMFGVITAVGISSLQFADMNSPRNIFIAGFSLFVGLAVPAWLEQNPESIATGVPGLDQVIQVLLTTSTFVGGALGFILDNTVPGSSEERGLEAWRRAHGETDGSDSSSYSPELQNCYDLPLDLSRLPRLAALCRVLPCCPSPALPPPLPPVDKDIPCDV
ncbi:solute carrier family 23 member 1-like [Lethenteron reissneri]|uniref:solute carrier family 23 member 1-like n=1 Tax=Lethenteron reissneri TaxID=7753 RepID=UPI002AB64B2E|nr:solute carrier family 23 member 1-like [Lethenteron reissneri]